MKPLRSLPCRRLAVILPLASLAVGSPLRAATAPEGVLAFIDRHCSSCHNDVDKEGGLDLTSLSFAPGDPANFQTWVKAHDRVQAGEMPPREKKRPPADEIAGFVRQMAATLVASERAAVAESGRAIRRRLNRTEYENILRSVLSAPWLQIRDQLPEDGERFRFNKSAEALDVSFVHLTRYMLAADYALRQALAEQYSRPPTRTQRFYARDDSGMTEWSQGQVNQWPDRKKFPVLDQQAQPDVRAYKAPLSVGAANPEVRDREAIGWVAGNYVTGFDSRWSVFRAPVAGRYNLRFSGYTLWVEGGGRRRWFLDGADRVGFPGPGEWYRPNADAVSPGRRDEAITVYSQGAVQNRRLGTFDLSPEPQVYALPGVWLLGGERIATDASRFFKSRPTGNSVLGGFTNPLAQRDGMPAVAFRWMEVEGPIYDAASGAGYRLLFGDLPLRKAASGGVPIEVIPPADATAGRGRRGAAAIPETRVEVVSNAPEADAERLLRGFLGRTYRRPVAEAEVQRFLTFTRQRMAAGLGFTAAMLAGYTAILSSPEFVFVDEKPGRLDHHALATRLALFLWNSEPDAALRQRAERGELHRPEILRAETERMLQDPRSRQFSDAFLDYWLELRRIDETTPSTTLYNDYYLDDWLLEAALDETQLFFAELLRADLPVRNVVDSDFTFLNERLAQHYGIAGVEGVKMRRVALPADTVRGGLMTQASVLKVTANGTTTSPVVRGKWIVDRIMGLEVPPPPAAVPAVEPDIRGAVSIRQQLDKHRADESCAACHRKIDPPGFALESFDVMGGWRSRYRGQAIDVDQEKGFGKNGWPYVFHFGVPVDSSGQLADGQSFRDVRDFKRIVLQQEPQVARNFARQLAVFATGSPIRFSDREEIERIVQRTQAGGYGVRSLVRAVVESELFLNK